MDDDLAQISSTSNPVYEKVSVWKLSEETGGERENILHSYFAVLSTTAAKDLTFCRKDPFFI